MNTSRPVSSTLAALLLRYSLALLIALAWLAPRAASQSVPQSGEIAGRIQNEAAGQYLTNARVTVRGTALVAFTISTKPSASSA